MTQNLINKYVLQSFKKVNLIKALPIMDWPPQSPGLNIIESAWDHFYLRTKQKVANIQRRPLNFFTPLPSFRTSHGAHETRAFILKDQDRI